jgi:hypothetical protein
MSANSFTAGFTPISPRSSAVSCIKPLAKSPADLHLQSHPSLGLALRFEADYFAMFFAGMEAFRRTS